MHSLISNLHQKEDFFVFFLMKSFVSVLQSNDRQLLQLIRRIDKSTSLSSGLKKIIANRGKRLCCLTRRSSRNHSYSYGQRKANNYHEFIIVLHTCLMKVTFIAKARASFSPPKPKEKRYVQDSPPWALSAEVETTKDKISSSTLQRLERPLSLLAIKQRSRQCLSMSAFSVILFFDYQNIFLVFT